jgi:hypothetical protein
MFAWAVCGSAFVPPPPTPGVAAEIAAIQQRLKIVARVGLGLLLFAVVAMSVARYL